MLNYVHSWIREAFLFWCRCSTCSRTNEQIPAGQNEEAGSRTGVFGSCLAATCSTWQDWLLSGRRLILLYTSFCALVLPPPLKCDVIVTVLLLCINHSRRPVEFFCLDDDIWGWDETQWSDKISDDSNYAQWCCCGDKVTWSGLALEKQPF